MTLLQIYGAAGGVAWLFQNSRLPDGAIGTEKRQLEMIVVGLYVHCGAKKLHHFIFAITCLIHAITHDPPKNGPRCSAVSLRQLSYLYLMLWQVIRSMCIAETGKDGLIAHTTIAALVVG